MKQFKENIPIYLQLRDEIERAILSGSVTPDEMLPSIRTLSRQYQLNPQTVANAFNELQTEGVIYKKRGIGFFVEKEAIELLRKKLEDTYRNIELRQTIRKGKTLGLSKKELIATIEAVYHEGGINESTGN
ncbi:MAG: GntR family transcriptional regulator [Candidatus Cloacimonetes bacterium]|nr:GntR family transcriptional regulator [Candidatus Cloacimonadota bacterium]